MRFIVGFVLLGISFLTCAAYDDSEAQIEQRTQPVGQVHVKEERNEQSINNEQTVTKEVPGQKIYERYCVVCHKEGLVGAPIIHDKQAWKSRLSGRTLNELVVSAVKGLNAMPAKGTCYECTDDDIKSAIEYMLPK